MTSSPEPTREEIHQWLRDFHEGTRSLKAKECLENVATEDFEVQYANLPLVKGRDAAIEWFQQPFNGLDLMIHHIEYFDYVSPKIYQKATIDYVVKGDDKDQDMITIPAFGVFYMRREDKLRCYRAETYLDAGAVFGKMAAKGVM